MSSDRPAHSPLGASSAERWMRCPGSVALIKELAIAETSDEPDYRANGTAAHEAIAVCLQGGVDAWEVVGRKMTNGVVCDVEMADAIQVFLTAVREPVGEPNWCEVKQTYIEHGFDAPDFHPDFFGTTDHAVVWCEPFDAARDAVDVDYGAGIINLDVDDYKHGEGVAVEVEWNPQVMYYAYGILVHHPEINGRVRMRVIQPRIPYLDAIRTFELSAEEVRRWAEWTLAPAMVRTQMDHTLDAGPHCRFCPAKLVCPLLTSLFRAAATHDPKEIILLEDASIGQSYQFVPAVKSYLKALEEEAYARLNRGGEIDGIKLVHKKANRVWKSGADKVMIDRFGDEVLTKPEVKSPAELEKLGPDAKTLVKEWAYTPSSGLTVALADDRRVAVKVQTTTEIFAGAVAALSQEE